MVCIFKQLSPVCADPICMIICDKLPSYQKMSWCDSFLLGWLIAKEILVIQGTLKTDINTGFHVSEIYFKTEVKLV